jgi:eukaryotic-like serine/threonine-protein kinase
MWSRLLRFFLRRRARRRDLRDTIIPDDTFAPRAVRSDARLRQLGPSSVLADKYIVEGTAAGTASWLVHAARHVQLDELRAIKTLWPSGDEVADARQVERLLHEAQIVGRLRSEHAIRIHDVDRLDSGVPYIVMEYLVGKTLQRDRDQKEGLPIETAVTYVIQACHVLAEAHAGGDFHGNIKPSNLFMTTGKNGAPCIKVTGFGLARLSNPYGILGTPLYMSPEQWRRRDVDARTDIWALGLVLYELLANRSPFEDTGRRGLFDLVHLEKAIEPPSSFRPELPSELDGIVMRCLSMDPDRRPSAEQLARELLSFAPRNAPLPAGWPPGGGDSDPSADRNASVRPGDVIAGKYRVQRVLGSGAMGIVVAATHIELDELRAIKLMLPGAAKDPRLVERFKRESRAAAGLRSEHAVKIEEVGSLPDGAPFIVMEHLVGVDLHRLLKRQGALAVETAVLYVVQACHAIAEAHAIGIVHRDLKPANLFLATREDGISSIKVLDFGIAKFGSNGSATLPASLTQLDEIMGSPEYMSPEQMHGTRDVDQRTDVWALGVILYELITGRRPFRGSTTPEIYAAVLHDRPMLPSDLRPGLPPALDAIILRCMDKNADRRMPTAQALAGALLPFGPPSISSGKIDGASAIATEHRWPLDDSASTVPIRPRANRSEPVRES